MLGRVPDRFSERLQLLMRFARHDAQPRRKLGVINAVLFSFGVLERCERVGGFLCLEILSGAVTSLAESNDEFQVRSRFVAIWPHFDFASCAGFGDLVRFTGVAWCLFVCSCFHFFVCSCC
jgi:hypothetical protein